MWITSLDIVARATCSLWFLFFASLFAFNATNFAGYRADASFLIARFVLPPIAARALLYAQWCGADARLAVAGVLLGLMLLLYAGEVRMESQVLAQRRRAAESTGWRFDSREKTAVILDLRRKGIDAYPVTRASSFLRGRKSRPLPSPAGPLLPMASIPHTTVDGGNELGEWLIYRSDRHGFNNPDSEWDVPETLIGMIGDSFAHGDCVPPDANLAAYLRRCYGTTLNLGIGGSGPLLQLAALKEYLEPRRPRVVLWVFFEGNDITDDLPRERRDPLLQDYLKNPEFSQGLIHRSGQVGSVLRNWADRRLRAAVARMDVSWIENLKALSLYRLRTSIGLGQLQIGYNAALVRRELDLFERILKAGRERVEAWRGTLMLVYLPESERFLNQFRNRVIHDTIHEEVHRIARRVGIGLIDVAAALEQVPDPVSLYAYPGGHFNVEGYRMAADLIVRRLARMLPGA